MPSTRTNVFISYSHQDIKWLERLKVFLKPLEREHKIEFWDDSKISPGSNWKDEIDRALSSCKVAVLLISGNFFASNFIYDAELPVLIDAAKTEGAKILCLIIGPSRFERSSLFKFQAINPLNKPLIDLSKSEKDEFLNKTSFLIEDILIPAVKSDPNSDSPDGPMTDTHTTGGETGQDTDYELEGDALKDTYVDLENENFRLAASPQEYLTETFNKLYGETRFLAEFVLDEEGNPRRVGKSYRVRLFIKDAPPDTQKVVYTLHESYIEPVRTVEKGVPEFELQVTTYGDYEVKISIQQDESEIKMKLWLSTALENFYGDDPGTEIFEAIKYLQQN